MSNNDFKLINCPSCNMLIQVLSNQINCTIFRCGIIKSTGQQLDSHASKEVCNYMIQNNLIYGCGKPFTFDGNSVSICDYI